MADKKEVKETQEQRRLARRRRRQRNTAFAYIALLLIVALIGGGVYYGVSYLKGAGNGQKPEPEVAESSTPDIESLLGSEESITYEEPVETEQELTPEQKRDEALMAAILDMTLEDKVAGLFIVTPESITGVSTAVKAGPGTQEALEKWCVGGIIYASKNIKDEAKFIEMVTNTASFSRAPIFLAVQEEGGKYSTVAGAHITTGVDGQAAIGATAEPTNAYNAGIATAAYLNKYGINLNFGPVADLSGVEGSVVGDRAYSSDSGIASSMVSSMVGGLQENGISACVMHFPGIGSSTSSVNAGLATINSSAEEFAVNEFPVFTSAIAAGVDMIMVSAAAAPALTTLGETEDRTPCALSSIVVTDILREQLGYDGIIITDNFSCNAIAEYYGAADAAILALRAGCDMILMPSDFEAAYNGVLEAVRSGVISEDRINDALLRIYRVKLADVVA